MILHSFPEASLSPFLLPRGERWEFSCPKRCPTHTTKCFWFFPFSLVYIDIYSILLTLASKEENEGKEQSIYTNQCLDWYDDDHYDDGDVDDDAEDDDVKYLEPSIRPAANFCVGREIDGTLAAPVPWILSKYLRLVVNTGQNKLWGERLVQMQSCYKFLWETYLVRWRLAALSRTEVVICASQISASCPSIGQLQEMEVGGT